MIKQRKITKQLHRELIYFICIGLLTTFLDFVIYSILQNFITYSIAKSISFISGSFCAYLLHKHFTFCQKQHSVKKMLRFAVLYVVSMSLNVSVNSASLHLLNKPVFASWLNHAEVLIAAFLIATATSTIINFLGQKFWVFKATLLQPVVEER